MITSDLQGLKGDVFNLGGKVAGAIPPSGRPNAISFRISGVRPGTSLFPGWAEMTIDGNIPVKINPDICKSPFVRLFDCVAAIGQNSDEILSLKRGDKLAKTFGGERFVFWVESLNSPFGKLNVIIVDTLERILKWNPQNLRVSDGQHRHRGPKSHR